MGVYFNSVFYYYEFIILFFISSHLLYMLRQAQQPIPSNQRTTLYLPVIG
jgi:hypothetical protein